MKLRVSLKWRRTPFPFLDAEMQLRLKLHVIELEKIYSSVFLLWTIFIHNIFLKTGSLMIACEKELKLSNHYNENASGKWHLILLQSFLSQQNFSSDSLGMLSVIILELNFKHKSFIGWRRNEKCQKTVTEYRYSRAKDRCSSFLSSIASADWLH